MGHPLTTPLGFREKLSKTLRITGFGRLGAVTLVVETKVQDQEA
jgi:hypothetical protein